MHKVTLAAVFIVGIFYLAIPHLAAAQRLPAMGPPIRTNLIVTKPAPDEIYGSRSTITVGVNGKTYKFILKDAYTDNLKTRWPDIWQYVQQYNPNFVVQGQDAEAFAKIQPGQTMTVSGMFAPLDRTFEVMTVDQGGNPSQHY